MAYWYVNSAAAGTNDGKSWVNACPSCAYLLANTAFAAGDSLAIANTSAETYATATTLTFPGTAASPNYIYSCDTTNSPPQSSDLLAGASVTTTGASALTLAGTVDECFGVTFSAGTGATNAPLTPGGTWNFDTCVLAKLGTTANTTSFAFSGVNVLKNTPLQFGNVGDAFRSASGSFYWYDTPSAIAGSIVPTTLMQPGSSGIVLLEAVDLLALGLGHTIFGALSSVCQEFLKDCKLGASVTVAATPTILGAHVFNIRSDSGNTNYRNEKYSYTGTETTETSITRVGGAAQADGTAFSRKYVATANAKWVLPFQGLPMAIWCPFSNGTHTVTIYGTWNSASVPNNDQIWCDVEYLGTSGNPLGVFATATKANNLASGTALTADASTWNGGGSGAGWSPFSMQISFSPTEAGYIYIYPKVAAASDTFWLDPAIGLQ